MANAHGAAKLGDNRTAYRGIVIGDEGFALAPPPHDGLRHIR
jgi:hypothetical protein